MVQRLISIGLGPRSARLSPLREFRVVFEDDGEAAYFYALNAPLQDETILDLMNILHRRSNVRSAHGSQC
jgi:hypothetical protein